MLEIRNLYITHGKSVRLKSISYTFPEKGMVQIEGANGIGKSSFCNALAGMLKPASGIIDFKDLNRYEDLGFVLEEQIGIPQLTYRQNLALAAKLRGLRENDYPVWFSTLETAMGLPSHQLLGLYSSGMKRKADLLLSLFFDPTVLVWDEPFRNLDDKGVALMRNFIQVQSAHKLFRLSSN